MLIRKLKAGDCLTMDGTVIIVKRSTEENLEIAIQAPKGMKIHHARNGEAAKDENPKRRDP